MASNISATIRINDAFSSPLSNLKSKLAQSANAMGKLKSGLHGGMNTNFTKPISSGLGNLNGQVTKTGGLFKTMLGANIVGAGVTRGIGMVSNGIRSMTTELNDSSKAWKTFHGNLEMLGKSPAQITATRNDLQKFAQKTIYSASDMASTYSQLAAVGTKSTGKLVKGFGGLAAASSDPAQAMKTLSQQATQAAAKPKIQWMDFKLMLEQTPAGMAAVAKTMGKSTGQLVKDVQAGKVKTQDFFDAIAKTGTNDNFSKMATQFKTVGQAADGLKENLASKLQPAFDKVSKVGINAISGLSDKLGAMDFSGLGDGLINFGSKISNAVNSLKPLAPYIVAVVGAFAGLSAISGILGGVTSAITTLGDGIFNFGLKIMSIPSMISSAFSAIGAGFSLLASPIVLVLAGITLAIVAAVYAWETNFLGVRNFLSAIFSSMGEIFEPLVSAFNQLKTALAPVVQTLMPMLGKVLGAIGVGVVIGLAVAFAALADSFTLLTIGATTVVYAIMTVVEGLNALGQALMGDFSGAGKSLARAKDDINGIGDALGHLNDKTALSSVIGALGELDTKASSTKDNLSNMEITPKLNTGNVFAQMDSLTKDKTANVNVKPIVQAGANPFAQIQSQANANPIKPKVDTSSSFSQMGNPFSGLQSKADANPIKAKVTADTSAAGNPLAKLQEQANTTPITPKVNTPKIPTATMKVKVETPKVPKPSMPTGVTMHVKVATPKVPKPTLPKLGTIPAPRVARPSMTGVISAVRSGMTSAAAAARSAGAGISSAVRSSVNRAVAAARGAAGAMRSAGAMIGAGLAAGIRSQVGAVAAAANALVAQANRAARAAAKIHSPSRLFAEIGDYMGQGMAVGMNATGSLVAGAGAAMAHSAFTGASGVTMPGVNPNASTPTSTPFGVSGNSLGFSGNNSAVASSATDSSRSVVIASGAIQINSTGNVEYDGQRLLNIIENELINVRERKG